ncbi:hypothetical protein BGX29_001685 [Mortierella sp. GBA35]|nr:hypothetical protein BGX29_001685 [Mortierella sp. GBA35]KAG0208616.1 hypothetical protein BGX33_006139 [Mortierella sp. NVP41]
MYKRHQDSQEQEQDRRQQQQQRQQRRQEQQSNNPFGDFFGGSHQGDYDPSDDPEAQSTDGSACRGYFCEENQVCVDRPIQCPCPYETDTKCLRGDWYVCYRGSHNC